MKTLLSFFSIIFLISTFSCHIDKDKDWDCICQNINDETEISRFIVFDAEEGEAKKECNKSDILTLGEVTIDCELE